MPESTNNGLTSRLWRTRLWPVFWMKINGLKAPVHEKSGALFRIADEECLRAAHEPATGDAGDAYESRAEQQHARRLGDVDVRITLGGGRKDSDRRRRGRNRLRLNGCRADTVAARPRMPSRSRRR